MSLTYSDVKDFFEVPLHERTSLMTPRITGHRVYVYKTEGDRTKLVEDTTKPDFITERVMNNVCLCEYCLKPQSVLRKGIFTAAGMSEFRGLLIGVRIEGQGTKRFPSHYSISDDCFSIYDCIAQLGYFTVCYDYMRKIDLWKKRGVVVDTTEIDSLYDIIDFYNKTDIMRSDPCVYSDGLKYFKVHRVKVTDRDSYYMFFMEFTHAFDVSSVEFALGSLVRGEQTHPKTKVFRGLQIHAVHSSKMHMLVNAFSLIKPLDENAEGIVSRLGSGTPQEVLRHLKKTFFCGKLFYLSY